MKYSKLTLYIAAVIISIILPGCGKKKRNKTIVQSGVGLNGSLSADLDSKLKSLEDVCGANLNIADTLGYNNYLAPIDGSKLKTEEPKAQSIDYDGYSGLVVSCNTMESDSHIDYQAEYCQITIRNSENNEVIKELNSYTGVEQIFLEPKHHGSILIVETKACTSRSENASSCGTDTQKTRINIKASTNEELSAHMIEMADNIEKRAEICKNLSQNAENYIKEVSPENLNKSQEIMYGLAKYILNNPERFADFCAENIIDYAIDIHQELESQSAGLYLTSDASQNQACKDLLEQLKEGNGSSNLNLNLTEAETSEEYHKRIKEEKEKNKDANEYTKYGLGGAFIIAGVVMLGVTVKLWMDFGKSLKASKNNHKINSGDVNYKANKLSNQQKILQQPPSSVDSQVKQPSKVPPELDSQGRIKQEFHDNGKPRASYEYNEKGQKSVVSEFDDQGTPTKKTTLEYDENRLMSQTESDLQKNTSKVTDYDPEGKVYGTEEIDENGKKKTTSYDYDDFGKQTSINVTEEIGGKTVTVETELDADGKPKSTITTTELGDGKKEIVHKNVDGEVQKKIVEAPDPDNPKKVIQTEFDANDKALKKIEIDSTNEKLIKTSEFELEDDGSTVKKQTKYIETTVIEDTESSYKTKTVEYTPAEGKQVNTANSSTFESSKTKTSLYELDMDTLRGKTTTFEEGSSDRIKQVDVETENGRSIVDYDSGNPKTKTVYESRLDPDGRRTGTTKKVIEDVADFDKPTKWSESSFDTTGKQTGLSNVSDVEYNNDTVTKKTQTDLDPETQTKKATIVSEFDDSSGNMKSQKRTDFDDTGSTVKKRTEISLDSFDEGTKHRSGTMLEYEGDSSQASKRTLVDVDESVPGKQVRTETELASPDPSETKQTKKTVYDQDRVRSQTDLDPATNQPKKSFDYEYDPETGRQKSLTEVDPISKKQNRLEFDTDGTTPRRSVDFDNGKLAQSTDVDTGRALSYEPDGKFKASGSIDTGGGSSRGFRQGNKLDMQDAIKRGGTNGMDFKKLPTPDEPKFRTTSGDVDINSGKVASGAGDGKFSTAGKGILAGLGSLATMALLGGGITLISTAAMELTSGSGCSGKPNPEMTFACHLGVAEGELISLIDEYQSMIEKRDEIIANSKEK